MLRFLAGRAPTRRGAGGGGFAFLGAGAGGGGRETSIKLHPSLDFVFVRVREREVHNFYSPNFLHFVVCADSDLSLLHFDGELTIVQDSSRGLLLPCLFRKAPSRGTCTKGFALAPPTLLLRPSWCRRRMTRLSTIITAYLRSEIVVETWVKDEDTVNGDSSVAGVARNAGRVRGRR